ncbi:MAG: hypothetical protein ACKN9K_26435, partial [Dolichospermum sp.]
NVVEPGEFTATELNELTELSDFSEAVINEREDSHGCSDALIPKLIKVSEEQTFESEVDSPGLRTVPELTSGETDSDSSNISTPIPNRRRRRRSSAMDVSG